MNKGCDRKIFRLSIIYLLFFSINLTFILKITDSVTYLGLIIQVLLLIILINFRHLSVRIVTILAFLLILMITNPYGFGNIAIYVVAALALYNDNIRSIVKAIFINNLIFFTVIVFLNIAGIISDTPIPKNHTFAHDYGLQNANTLSLYIIYTLMSVFILYYKKSKLLGYIIFLIVLCCYQFTLSRGLLAIGILILLFSIINPKYIASILFNRCSIVLSIILIPITILYLLYSPNLEILDSVTSKRASFMFQALSNFNTKTLFTGISIPDDVIIDNVYMLMTIYGGIITLSFVLLRYYKIMTEKNYPYQYLCFLFSMFVLGYVESCFINPFIPGTYLVWILLVGNKSLKLNRNEHCSLIHFVQP